MSRSNLVISLAVALMFGLGGVGHALAMPLIALEHDSMTSYRFVPTSHVDRYVLNVESPARVSIYSEGWGSIGVNMIMKARLLDDGNNVISHARRRGGHFVIHAALDTGRYVLEVEGQEISDRVPINNRYQVITTTF